MSKILVLGDSFTYGHGCKDKEYYFDPVQKKKIGSMENLFKGPSQYSWPSLISSYVSGYTAVNLAVPGCSNQGMFKEFKNYCLKNSLDNIKYIFYCGTSSGRIEIGNSFDETKTASWVLGSSIPEKENYEFERAKTDYIKHLYNREVGDIMMLSALLSVFAIASVKNIKFYFSLSRLEMEYLEKNAQLCYLLRSHNIESMTDYDYSKVQSDEINKKFRAPDNHVNEKGHLTYLKDIILPLIK